MGKIIEKYAGSLRFWVLIVVAVYFAYGVYFAASGMRDSISMLSNQQLYTSLAQNPWWWMVLFYGSEGLTGSISIISRAVAGAFAFYAAFLYWRKKDAATPTIRKSASTALLFEAIFFLALIPSIIAAVTYNLTSEKLFYFGHTPEMLLIYGTVLPILAIVLVVPPLLLKLRAAIKHEASQQEIVKWACLTAVAYLFVVFWFTYCMFWMGETVPYPGAYPQWGLNFVLQPANLLSFSLTVFGLLAIATAALITTLPAIKKQTTQLNLTRIGIIMIAFGGYFIFNVFYYYLTGGYPANPSVWYEVIGPLHNPNLWTIALAALGVPVLIHGKTEKRKDNSH
jgi:magnesium-transporting ATPase (P-type)